jgi:hypothetical protein
MGDHDDRGTQTEPERYRPAEARIREEVGGILEHAFQREGGRQPNEEEVRRFLALANEAETRAEAAEYLAGETEQAAVQAAERYALTGGADDLAALQRYEAEAEAYRREAEAMRLEAEHLRQYLP